MATVAQRLRVHLTLGGGPSAPQFLSRSDTVPTIVRPTVIRKINRTKNGCMVSLFFCGLLGASFSAYFPRFPVILMCEHTWDNYSTKKRDFNERTYFLLFVSGSSEGFSSSAVFSSTTSSLSAPDAVAEAT